MRKKKTKRWKVERRRWKVKGGREEEEDEEVEGGEEEVEGEEDYEEGRPVQDAAAEVFILPLLLRGGGCSGRGARGWRRGLRDGRK